MGPESLPKHQLFKGVDSSQKHAIEQRHDPDIAPHLEQKGIPQETRSVKTMEAQTAALVSDTVTIIAFEGLHDALDKGSPPEPPWEKGFEFIGDTAENFIYTNMQARRGTGYEVLEHIKGRDEQALWQVVTQYTSKHPEIIGEIGEYDLYNLTPYQATYLAGKIVSDTMEYDYSLIEDIGKFNLMTDTSRKEELLQLYRSDRQAYNQRVTALNNETDATPAHTLLTEKKKGVCRHMAMASAALFKTLKSYQQGESLHNTSLLYFHPRGELAHAGADHNHAYNLFIQKLPTEGDEHVGEFLMSVIDPTWANGKTHPDFDQTYRRLSVPVSFVDTYRLPFGFSMRDTEQLSREVLHRFDTPPKNLGLFTDYLSLTEHAHKSKVAQSQSSSEPLIMENVIVDEVMKSVPLTERARYLNAFFRSDRTSSFSEIDGYPIRLLEDNFRTPIFNQIGKISFDTVSIDDPEYKQDIEQLAFKARVEFLQRAHAYTDNALRVQLTEKGFDALYYTYLRICQEQNYTPPPAAQMSLDRCQKILDEVAARQQQASNKST